MSGTSSILKESGEHTMDTHVQSILELMVVFMQVYQISFVKYLNIYYMGWSKNRH